MPVLCAVPAVTNVLKRGGAFLRHVCGHGVYIKDYGLVFRKFPLEEAELLLQTKAETGTQQVHLDQIRAMLEATKASKVEALPLKQESKQESKQEPKIQKKKYKRSKNFAESVKDWADGLCCYLHEHATAARKGKPDVIVSKVGRFYTASVHSLCEMHNCCPKYGLYCFGFISRFGNKLIRRINLTTNGHGGMRATLVLNTQFVIRSPQYYQRQLASLSIELERHRFPWDGAHKPTCFSAVMQHVMAIPPFRTGT